jgi:triphosphatase
MSSVASRELKLELTPQELQRVGEHPALGDLTVGKPVTRTLRSIYFDTPDHRLRAQGMSLRLRSIGDRWLQTIRPGPGASNGATGSATVETELVGPEPDLAAINDGKVRRQIEKAVKASTLEPQFETLVTRTTRKLHSDKGDLELALDEGVIRAGAVESKLCEAELELKAGSPECLLETAAALFSAEPIRLAEASKSERGYNLLLRSQDANVTPQKARHVALGGDETCAQALAMFVDAASEQIALNRRALLETDDPEAAHQFRIGLRRLRSALRVFRPLADTPATRELEQHAREVGRCISELRNADVFIESIYSPVAGTKKGEPGFGELREALLAHRAARRDGARAALAGDHWSKLQLYLLLWPRTVEGNDRLQAAVRPFAQVALGKAWKKIARQADDVAGLSVEQRHDLRKSLKGFRYAAEFLGTLYDKEKVDRFIKDLKALQDVFGYVNDVATAKELGAICQSRCAESSQAQRAAGYVLGWHDVNARQQWERAPKEWRRLNKRVPFWEQKRAGRSRAAN